MRGILFQNRWSQPLRNALGNPEISDRSAGKKSFDCGNEEEVVFHPECFAGLISTNYVKVKVVPPLRQKRGILTICFLDRPKADCYRKQSDRVL